MNWLIDFRQAKNWTTSRVCKIIKSTLAPSWNWSLLWGEDPSIPGGSPFPLRRPQADPAHCQTTQQLPTTTKARTDGNKNSWGNSEVEEKGDKIITQNSWGINLKIVRYICRCCCYRVNMQINLPFWECGYGPIVDGNEALFVPMGFLFMAFIFVLGYGGAISGRRPNQLLPCGWRGGRWS